MSTSSEKAITPIETPDVGDGSKYVRRRSPPHGDTKSPGVLSRTGKTSPGGQPYRDTTSQVAPSHGDTTSTGAQSRRDTASLEMNRREHTMSDVSGGSQKILEHMDDSVEERITEQGDGIHYKQSSADTPQGSGHSGLRDTVDLRSRQSSPGSDKDDNKLHNPDHSEDDQPHDNNLTNDRLDEDHNEFNSTHDDTGIVADIEERDGEGLMRYDNERISNDNDVKTSSANESGVSQVDKCGEETVVDKKNNNNSEIDIEESTPEASQTSVKSSHIFKSSRPSSGNYYNNSVKCMSISSVSPEPVTGIWGQLERDTGNGQSVHITEHSGPLTKHTRADDAKSKAQTDGTTLVSEKRTRTDYDGKTVDDLEDSVEGSYFAMFKRHESSGGGKVVGNTKANQDQLVTQTATQIAAHSASETVGNKQVAYSDTSDSTARRQIIGSDVLQDGDAGAGTITTSSELIATNADSNLDNVSNHNTDNDIDMDQKFNNEMSLIENVDVDQEVDSAIDEDGHDIKQSDACEVDSQKDVVTSTETGDSTTEKTNFSTEDADQETVNARNLQEGNPPNITDIFAEDEIAEPAAHNKIDIPRQDGEDEFRDRDEGEKDANRKARSEHLSAKTHKSLTGSPIRTGMSHPTFEEMTAIERLKHGPYAESMKNLNKPAPPPRNSGHGAANKGNTKKPKKEKMVKRGQGHEEPGANSKGKPEDKADAGGHQRKVKGQTALSGLGKTDPKAQNEKRRFFKKTVRVREIPKQSETTDDKNKDESLVDVGGALLNEDEAINLEEDTLVRLARLDGKKPHQNIDHITDVTHEPNDDVSKGDDHGDVNLPNGTLGKRSELPSNSSSHQRKQDLGNPLGKKDADATKTGESEKKVSSFRDFFSAKNKTRAISSPKTNEKQSAKYTSLATPGHTPCVNGIVITTTTADDAQQQQQQQTPASDVMPVSLTIVDETASSAHSKAGRVVLANMRLKMREKTLSNSINSNSSLPIHGRSRSPSPETSFGSNGSKPAKIAHKTHSMSSLQVPGPTPNTSPREAAAQEEDNLSLSSRRDSARHSFDSSARRSMEFRLQQTTAVMQAEADEKPKSVLTNDETFIKNAIPYLPLGLAIGCLILNVIIPGSGTALSGLSILCCGQARVSNKNDQILTTLCANCMVGLAQLFTVTFFLVGWFWSIGWGIQMVSLSVQHRETMKKQRAKELQALALSAFGSPKRGSPFG